MKLLIVASGLATRVYSYTYQKIPKYLISLDHYFGLYYMIQYWKQYVDEIYIVIHPYYKKITEYVNFEIFIPTIKCIPIKKRKVKPKSIKNHFIPWLPYLIFIFSFFK